MNLSKNRQTTKIVHSPGAETDTQSSGRGYSSPLPIKPFYDHRHNYGASSPHTLRSPERKYMQQQQCNRNLWHVQEFFLRISKNFLDFMHQRKSSPRRADIPPWLWRPCKWTPRLARGGRLSSWRATGNKHWLWGRIVVVPHSLKVEVRPSGREPGRP